MGLSQQEPLGSSVCPASHGLYTFCVFWIRPWWGLPKPIFWFEWTNLALAWEPQGPPPPGPNNGTRPWSCLSLWALPCRPMYCVCSLRHPHSSRSCALLSHTGPHAAPSAPWSTHEWNKTKATSFLGLPVRVLLDETSFGGRLSMGVARTQEGGHQSH